MKTLFGVVVSIIIIDVFGFMFWVASGQFPIDDFFVGRITTEVIKILF